VREETLLLGQVTERSAWEKGRLRMLNGKERPGVKEAKLEETSTSNYLDGGEGGSFGIVNVRTLISGQLKMVFQAKDR